MPQIEQSAVGSLLVIHGCMGQAYKALFDEEGCCVLFLPKKNQRVNAIRAMPPKVTMICAVSMIYPLSTVNPRRRRALVTTLTEDIAMVSEAMIGLNSQPVNGYRMPAAIGIPRML